MVREQDSNLRSTGYGPVEMPLLHPATVVAVFPACHSLGEKSQPRDLAKFYRSKISL